MHKIYPMGIELLNLDETEWENLMFHIWKADSKVHD